MSRHIENWLQAYFDDELGPKRKKLVEAHLSKCEECQTRLDELQELSTLLSTEPALDVNANQFVSQVMLRLPRKVKQPWWKQALRFAYSAIPALLFFILGFIHASSLSNNLLVGVEFFGIGGEEVSSLLVNPVFSEVVDLMDYVNIGFLDVGSTLWEIVGSFDLLGIDLIYSIVLPILIGALAISWMIGWWVMQEKRQDSI